MSANILRFKQEIPQTWQEALDSYLFLKQAQGLRKATITGHRDVVRCFFNRHPDAWPPGSNISQYIYTFMGEEIAPATYNIRRNYLRQFFDWGISEGIFVENPLDRLHTKKTVDRRVNITVETLQQLLFLPNTKTFAGLRDRALLLLSLDTGIRPQEAFRLQPKDFAPSAHEIALSAEKTKTGSIRTLPICAVTHKAIADLLSARPAEWGMSAPLFCTFEGGMMNRHAWNDRLEHYSKLLGVKIRPYDLRHSFAIQFLRNGGNVFALQKIMGHASLNMTRHYLALNEEDIREQHFTASPVAWLLPKKTRKRRVIS